MLSPPTSGIGAGRRLDSPALTADGNHARADEYVSLVVVASAAAVASGLPIADAIIGLVITVVILRITCESWRTVRAGDGDLSAGGTDIFQVGGPALLDAPEPPHGDGDHPGR
jgi:cation efflux family protein